MDQNIIIMPAVIKRKISSHPYDSLQHVLIRNGFAKVESRYSKMDFDTVYELPDTFQNLITTLKEE